MNVLLITLADIWSLDEHGVYPDLMREFGSHGHFVAIVSPTASNRLSDICICEGKDILIVKLPSGSIQKTNSITKAFNTIALDSRLKRVIVSRLAHIKFDLVLYSTPPVTITQTISYVKKRDNAQTYLLLKDIFPQNAVDLGMLRTGGFMGLMHKFFEAKERELYRVSDYIGCMSPANVKYLLANNPFIPPERVEVCPNSIEQKSWELSDEERAYWRAKYDLPQDKPIFVYGGNIGKPQGVDFIIECLKANEAQPRALFMIVGSGTEFNKLQRYFSSETPRQARLLSLLSQQEYDYVCAACDVGLIFLDHRFTIPNFPSRLLAYMDASMPILAATDCSTDLGIIIEEGKFGLWCESTNVDVFMQQVQQLCNPTLRKQMGQAARHYLEQNYTSQHSYNVIMNHFIGGKSCSTTKPC